MKKKSTYDIKVLHTLYANALNDNQRRNLKFIPFISIDNANAKILEDSLFVLPNESNKGFSIFVSITDATSFIEKNSMIDNIALKNPFSSNMIPNDIKEELGSFKKSTPQISLVCQIELNKEGIITSYSFYEALCTLQYVLSFKDTANIIENKNRHLYNPLVIYVIKLLHFLSHLIRSPRISLGNKLLSLAMEKNSMQSFKLPSEEILKTFMTITNICAAKFTMQYAKATMVRVAPDVVHQTYNVVFQDNDNDDELMYCDFTSPLRRYAGLVIHRIIKGIIQKNNQNVYSKKELTSIHEELNKHKKE